MIVLPAGVAENCTALCTSGKIAIANKTALVSRQAYLVLNDRCCCVTALNIDKFVGYQLHCMGTSKMVSHLL